VLFGTVDGRGSSVTGGVRNQHSGINSTPPTNTGINNTGINRAALPC